MATDLVEIKVESKMESVRRPAANFIRIPPAGWVQYLDHMGSDETVIEAARTSTGRSFISWEPYEKCERCGVVKATPEGARSCTSRSTAVGAHEWKNFARGDLGILEYLWKNDHATLFEMPVVRFLVKAPIFYWRQRHRHRAASYNEQSARYSQLPNDFYFPLPEEVCKQSAVNKQGSSEPLEHEKAQHVIEDMQIEQQKAYAFYQERIDAGVANETARMNLPVSIYSVGIVQANLRMELHMLGLRDDAHAQALTQQYARVEAAFVKALFPRTYAAYEEFTKGAVTLSRSEAEMVKNWVNPAWSDEAKVIYRKLGGV